MSSGRLLLVTLFLCSLPALTQDHALTNSSSTLQATANLRLPAVASRDEPGRVAPKSDRDNGILLSTPETELGRKGVVVSPDGPLAADTTCYAIRSYVVKRDSKDSDSVHPVGYSTCVPATRYRLKTADAAAAISLTK